MQGRITVSRPKNSNCLSLNSVYSDKNCVFALGIKIGDLLTDVRHSLKLRELKGQILGIDAYVMMYQFLARIRQDMSGEEFTDAEGQTTSHLIGMFYRTVALLEEGIKVVFVFDGPPPDFKRTELARRAELKRRAEEARILALEQGKIEEAAKFAQRTVSINEKILGDSKRLLDLLGVPYLTAKHDAEAQLAVMAQQGVVNAVASQDYDTFLFGAPLVARNITVSQVRRSAVGQVTSVIPEKIYLEEALKYLGINRNQLINLGLLVGTDFNHKIPKVGPSTALKLVQEYTSWESLESYVKRKYLSPEDNFDNYFSAAPPSTIINYFFNPPYTKDYKLTFDRVDIKGTLNYLVDEKSFGVERVKQRLKKLEAMQKQKKLTSFLE